MIKRIKKRIFSFASLALMFTCGCSGQHAIATPEQPIPKGTDMVLSDGVHLVEAIDGVTTWDIRSNRATYSTASGLLNFHDVKASYFQEGKLAYNVSGREGNYDSNKKIIHLTGDVFGSSQSGYTLKTQSLKYDMNNEVADTPDRVEISGTGIEISGVGFVADFKAKTFRILDETKVFAQPAEAPK